MALTLTPLTDQDKSAYAAYAAQEEFDDDRDTAILTAAAVGVVEFVVEGGFDGNGLTNEVITISQLPSNIRLAIFEKALALTLGRGGNEVVTNTPVIRSLLRQYQVPVR